MVQSIDCVRRSPKGDILVIFGLDCLPLGLIECRTLFVVAFLGVLIPTIRIYCAETFCLFTAHFDTYAPISYILTYQAVHLFYGCERIGNIRVRDLKTFLEYDDLFGIYLNPCWSCVVAQGIEDSHSLVGF
jgi:hypothetical protein